MDDLVQVDTEGLADYVGIGIVDAYDGSAMAPERLIIRSFCLIHHTDSMCERYDTLFSNRRSGDLASVQFHVESALTTNGFAQGSHRESRNPHAERSTCQQQKWHTCQRARYGFCGYGPTICLTPVDGYGAPGLLCF
jgi:hypothetical protein